MAFRITANVAPGLVRDPHRLARIDRAVGRERMESWHPRGQPHGCIAWQTETRDEALRLRAMLAHAMLDRERALAESRHHADHLARLAARLGRDLG